MSKFSKEQILNSTQTGFEFEFFSELSGKEIATSLSKSLGKKIVLPFEVSGFNKKEIKAKPEEKPDENKFLLTPDYSGGDKMQELVTGALHYPEARIQLIKTLDWISKNGYTTGKTGIHINVSFKKDLHLLQRNDIINMDRLKFCLSFNENNVYKSFPDRKDNVYAASIKKIIPANPFAVSSSSFFSPNNFLTPNTKYFTVNFLKQEKNYLEFRAMGGTDYEKKTQQILDIMDDFILQLFYIIEDQEYTENDKVKIKDITEKHKKIVSSFPHYDIFLYNYPKILLTVDLKNDREVMLTFWNILRMALYNLIVFGGLKEGVINYDTDASVIQIKDATLTKASQIYNYEMFNSFVDGMFYNCKFYDCTIKRSHLHDCSLVKGNSVLESKIIKTPIQFSNLIDNCYIDNEKTIVNGKLKKTIIRKGEISELADLDDKCIIVK